MDSYLNFIEKHKSFLNKLRSSKWKIIPQPHISLLVGGHEFVAQLFYNIDRAQSQIWISLYSIDNSPSAALFWSKLVNAAARGVKVVLLLETLNSEQILPRIRELEKVGGVFLSRNRAGILSSFMHLFNREYYKRDHQKIYLIDEKLIISSANIGDQYSGPHFGDNFFSDISLELNHMLLREAIDFMSLIFSHSFELHKFINQREIIEKVQAWRKEYLQNCTWDLFPTGKLICSFQPHIHELQQHLSFQIRHAQKALILITPYYFGIEQLEEDLIRARRRGVEVTIITSRKRDVPTYRPFSTFLFFRRLIDEGVLIYDFGPQFLHAKATLIDNNVLQVGSFNLDHWSYFVNTEVNAEVWCHKDAILQLNNYISYLCNNSDLLNQTSPKDARFKNIVRRYFWGWFLYLTNELFMYNIYRRYFPRSDLFFKNPEKIDLRKLIFCRQLNFCQKFTLLNFIKSYTQ